MSPEQYINIVDKTAIYPNRIEGIDFYSGEDYSKSGLIGEFGEVCNKIKKIFRDEQGVYSKETVQNLTKELGDVYWYIAALCKKEFNISFTSCFYSSRKLGFSDKKNYLFPNLYRCIAYIGQICTGGDEDNRESDICHLMNCLESVSNHFDISVENILQENYNKLSARLGNNTLQGSGDNR